MENRNDNVLLKRFAESGDEGAFRELADRYTGLVFGTARRHCANHHMAEEATQRVFTILARKATALCVHPTLGGWLFRSAFYESTKVMRAETTRRGKHEQWGELEEIKGMPEPSVPPETVVALDEALAGLSTKERELVVMRYFRRASFGQIGAQLGISENAGQKRTGRVLEKLAGMLERKGVGLSGATLGTVLASSVGESAAAAPAGLAASVAQQAVAASGAAATGVTFVLGSHIKIAALVAASAALVPVGHHWATSSSRAASLADSSASHAAMPTALASKPTYDLEADPLFGGTGNPAERMRRILDLEDWNRQRAEIRFLVGELAIADLPAALAVLTELQPEEPRHLAAFIESWAARDPETAMAFIGTRSVAFSERYWDALIKGWTSKSPEAVWGYISGLPDDAASARRLNAWLSEVCATDGAAALAMLAEAPDRVRSRHIEAIFHNWPSDRRAEALDRIAGLGNGDWSRPALQGLFAAPANALDASWLTDIEDRFGEAMRANVDKAFYEHWLVRDPLAAIEHLRDLADPKALGRAMERLRYSDVKSHFEEQFALVDKVGVGDERGLRQSVMHRWLKADPEAAEAFVSVAPADQQGIFAKAMAAHFSQREPERAIEWARQLVDGQTRDAFLGHFLNDLVARDFDFALGLMGQIKRPELIQELAPEIAEAYAGHDPELALAWAQENCAPEQVGAATEAAVRRWAMSDPAAASAWFAQQEPDAVRAAAAKGLANALHQRGDSEAAMDLSLTVRSGSWHWSDASYIVNGWVQRDARGFLDWRGRQSPEVQSQLRQHNGSFGAWLIEDGE